MRRPQGKLTNAWVSINDAKADQNSATLKQLYQDSDMPDALREAHDSFVVVDRAFGAKTAYVSADDGKRVRSTSRVELTALDHLPIPRKGRARR